MLTFISAAIIFCFVISTVTASNVQISQLSEVLDGLEALSRTVAHTVDQQALQATQRLEHLEQLVFGVVPISDIELKVEESL